MARSTATDGREWHTSDARGAYSRRCVLAGGAAFVGAVGLGTSVAAGQSETLDLEVSVADDSIDGDETTRLTVTLYDTPANGLTGWTVYLDLSDDGEAVFTGDWEATDEISSSGLDVDGDTAAYAVGADTLGELDEAKDELVLVDAEIAGSEAGDVEVGVEVRELWDGDENPLDTDVTTDSFTVEGDSSGGLPSTGDGDDNDDSGDGDDSDGGGVDVGGVDEDGGDGDDPAGSPQDDEGSDEGSDDDAGAGDDGDDALPGFGVGAAVTAVLAGAAARYLHTAVGDGDDIES